MERLSVLVNLPDKTHASRVRIALLRPQYFTGARSTQLIVVLGAEGTEAFEFGSVSVIDVLCTHYWITVTRGLWI